MDHFEKEQTVKVLELVVVEVHLEVQLVQQVQVQMVEVRMGLV